eukprot:scaffold16024_cov258-Ochromonas_danica.AAC.10
MIGSFIIPRISNCSSWQVDLSSPSVVTGNAGRQWSNATFYVQGLTYASNTTNIVNEMYKQFAFFSLMVIDNSLLKIGETYLVRVTLCNFLQRCGSKELRTTVSNTTASLPPVVALSGGTTSRSIFVNESLQLTADGYLLQCDDKRSTSGLRYIWRIKLSSSTTSSWLSLTSQSKDAKKFLLPSYSLLADSNYSLVLTVQDTATLLSSSVNVSIAVQSADLVAVISPASSQLQLRMGSGSLTLNASSSFDPNTVGKSVKTQLSYRWSCNSTSASGLPLSYCAVIVSSFSSSAVMITCGNESSVGTVSTIAVTVVDSAKPLRKTATQVHVEVIARSAPMLNVISAPSTLKYINVDRTITLNATVLSPLHQCNTSWSVDDSTLDMDDIISSLYTKTVPINFLTYVNLHLTANALVGGTTYTFSLSCRLISIRRRLSILDGSDNSSISVVVTTNSPPYNGRLYVAPQSGYALNTSFLISTDMWVDIDLPLSYAFSFLSSTSGGVNTYLPLNTRSEVSKITAILASANGVKSGTNVSVIAQDSYSASSSRLQSMVQIIPASSASLASLASSLLSQKDSLSTDELQNIISAVTSVVNVVDCSASPNCSSLHRASCVSTANTCGSCYGNYLSTGSDGDDNSACLSLVAISNQSSSHSSCISSSQCSSWQYCNASSRCSDSSKSCVSASCSSHGVCRYISSSTSLAVSSCSLISSTCEAVCSCVDGYGGSDCSMTKAELAAQQALRSSLLDGLSTVISSTDSDATSLSNAAASLSSIVRNQYDVSATSSTQVASIAQSIIDQASQVSSGASGGSVAVAISGVLKPIDSSINAIVSSGSNSSASALKNISSVIFSFQDLLIKEQQSYSVAYDTFRLTTVVYDNAVNGSIAVPMPLTQQEQIEKALTGSTTVPSLSVTSNGNATGGVYVSVVLIDQQTYVNNNKSQQLNSDVITIRTKNVDYVDITLTPTSTQDYHAIKYSVVCPPKIVVTKNFTCPDSGIVMYARCNGTAGTYNGTCPILVQTCASLGLMGKSSSTTSKEQCFAVNGTRSSSSGNSLTCRCVVVAGAIDSTVAAGLVLQYVGGDISRTFRASTAVFSSPAAFGKAYVVVSLYSALWGSAFLAMLFFGWKKSKQEKNKKKEYSSHRGKRDSNAISSTTKETEKEIRQKLSEYIKTVFPAIFDAKSVVEGWQSEMYRHHFYVNFFFKLSLSESPAINVAKMLTLQSFMLFLLALLYDLNYPGDDGTCPTHKTIDTCLSRKYFMDASRSYCEWAADANGTYGCSFADPSFSLTTAMYISMIIAVATCLASEPLEEMMGLLSAPSSLEEVESHKGGPSTRANDQVTAVIIKERAATKDQANEANKNLTSTNGNDGGLETRGAELVRPSLASSRRPSFHATCPVRHLPEDAVAAHDATYQVAKQFVREINPLLQRRESYRLELIHRASNTMGYQTANVNSTTRSFGSLFEEVILQRTLLQSAQLEAFDRAWCLNSNTRAFYEIRYHHWMRGPQIFYSENLVKEELNEVSEQAEEVLTILDSTSDVHKGFEILQLFVRDLLGRNTPAARIFAVKSELDFEPVETSSWTTKIVVTLVVIGVNIFFVYYTILKGYTKGIPWQQDYVKAWIAQVLLDIFLFETILCTWLHIVVPYLVSKEVNSVYILLQECIMRLNDNRYYEDPNICLNATNYFFVSHRVAESYPQLVESALVLSYANHLPGEVSKLWQQKIARFNRRASSNARNRTWLRYLAMFFKTGLISSMVYLGAYAPLPLQRLVIRVMEPLILSALTLGFYFFMNKPIYLAVLFGGLIILTSLLVWDYYYRTKKSSTGGRPGSAKSFRSIVPIVAINDEAEHEEVIKEDLQCPPPPAPFADEEESPMILHKASQAIHLIKKERVRIRCESEGSSSLDSFSEHSMIIPTLSRKQSPRVENVRPNDKDSRNEIAKYEVKDDDDSRSSYYAYDSDESLFSRSSVISSSSSSDDKSGDGDESSLNDLPSILLSPFLSRRNSSAGSHSSFSDIN